MIPIPMSLPSPSVSFFELGPFKIHYYALCILAGIVFATFLTNRRLTSKGAEPGVVFDIIIFAIPLGLLGARIYHVLTHPHDYFYDGANLWRTLFIWEGGNAIFGALIGGALGVFIACRVTKIRFWAFADAVAPGLLIAQGVGRLGNWFNHELFGVATTVPWGLSIESSNPAFPVGLPEGTLFHPMFLYEMLWNFFGAFLLLSADKKFSFGWGKVFALYLVWYGLGRSILENFRLDPSEYFFGFRTNVVTALVAIALGVVLFYVQTRRHPGQEQSAYRDGHNWQPVTVVESETVETLKDTSDENSETPEHNGDASGIPKTQNLN